MTGNSCLFLHGSFSFTGNLNLALAQLWAGGCLVLSQKLSLKTWLSLWQDKKGESPLPFTDLPKSLATLFD